jgi:hypothetical protein
MDHTGPAIWINLGVDNCTIRSYTINIIRRASKMKKTLLTIAATIAISTSAQAETYASYEACLNSQGKIFASMRKGYCSDSSKIAPTAAEIQAKKDAQAKQESKLIAMVVEHNQAVAKQLKLAKKAGMTCAIRTDGKGLDFVMCKDEVGTFRLID